MQATGEPRKRPRIWINSLQILLLSLAFLFIELIVVGFAFGERPEGTKFIGFIIAMGMFTVLAAIFLGLPSFLIAFPFAGLAILLFRAFGYRPEVVAVIATPVALALGLWFAVSSLDNSLRSLGGDMQMERWHYALCFVTTVLVSVWIWQPHKAVRT